MKFTQGTYENLITDNLLQDMQETTNDGLVCKKEDIDTEETPLFFVTLNKSDKDFSATTMYDDHVIYVDTFHWKSQNTDSHQGKGRRFVEQKANGKKFLLFVREYKKDGYGNTCPFICFGLKYK